MGANSESGSAVGMLHTMADMQHHHNEQVHAQWAKQGYEYYRAIWVECAEMLDHFGWKWWKKQDPDINQVKLELVDIWHFALSDLLRADMLKDSLATELSEVDTSGEQDPRAFRASIEALAESSLRTQSFEIEPFLEAMRTLPMSYEELFAMYIGKNVLNQFRQNNGYKSGEYRKVWQGREDNEHLVELLDTLLMTEQVAPRQLPDKLYAELEARYAV